MKFDESDVIKALDTLRVDKAVGLDGLSRRLLKETKEYQLPLYLLFKKSFSESAVPDDWKCANVTPIFKKGNRNLADNYRPVSLTSQISRLFEKIIRDSMVHLLEENSLIGESQHGFRKGRSCLTKLLTFIDKVTGSLDSGVSTDLPSLPHLAGDSRILDSISRSPAALSKSPAFYKQSQFPFNSTAKIAPRMHKNSPF